MVVDETAHPPLVYALRGRFVDDVTGRLVAPQPQDAALTEPEASPPITLTDSELAGFRPFVQVDTPSGRRWQEVVRPQAVDDFITALRADPYNIEATYSLSAAYATIGRYQCTINLLTRLLQMRPHPAKHADVEAHIDKLLGRKQPLDPDFAEMRKDDRFRALIQKMCEGTNDANCVYGAQRENRER